MADITSIIQKMNDVEIDSDAPVSEALLTKVGANINALIDRTNSLGEDFEVFNNTQTWTCPAGVTSIYVEGCGGGASGRDGPLSVGGNAAALVRKRLKVTPGFAYSVTVGGGGSGVYGNGGDSTITRAGVTLFRAPGAGGGTGYQGNGAQVYSSTVLSETIGNTFDGAKVSTAWGGQAGPYGSGAAGATSGVKSNAGSNTGAGGGGQASSSQVVNIGDGGSGKIVISYFGQS